MPKKYLMLEETNLLVQLEDSSDFSSPFKSVAVARLLGIGVSSQLTRQLAEAESEPFYNNNGWRS